MDSGAVSKIGAWRDREVDLICEHLAPHVLQVFHEGLKRGRLAREAFGEQSLAPLCDQIVEEAFCGLCLNTEPHCRCDVDLSRARSFLGREAWD